MKVRWYNANKIFRSNGDEYVRFQNKRSTGFKGLNDSSSRIIGLLVFEIIAY